MSCRRYRIAAQRTVPIGPGCSVTSPTSIGRHVASDRSKVRKRPHDVENSNEYPAQDADRRLEVDRVHLIRYPNASRSRGREAEGTRLLNEHTPKRVSRVRIPPTPPFI